MRIMKHSLRLLIVGLVPALILIFNVRPLQDSPAAAAPQPQGHKQTYVFLNIMGTGQSTDDLERLRLQFFERIRNRYSDLDVTFENRPWLTTTTCSKGHNCDFITIDLRDEQLLIRCAASRNPIRLPLPVLRCPHEKTKCIQSLPILLPSKLWSHDEIHRNQN